jgi:hypothetical protein
VLLYEALKEASRVGMVSGSIHPVVFIELETKFNRGLFNKSGGPAGRLGLVKSLKRIRIICTLR